MSIVWIVQETTCILWATFLKMLETWLRCLLMLCVSQTGFTAASDMYNWPVQINELLLLCGS